MQKSSMLLLQKKLDESMEDRRRAKGDADALKNQSKVSLHANKTIHGTTGMALQLETWAASIKWCAWHPGIIQDAVQSDKTTLMPSMFAAML